MPVILQNTSIDTQNIASSATGITLNSSGLVFYPQRPHICIGLNRTSGGGIFNNVTTTYTSKNLSFVTDRVTVSVPGIYLVGFGMLAAVGTSGQNAFRADIRIVKNGTAMSNTLNQDNEEGYKHRSNAIALSLAANDYVQVSGDSVYNESGDEWRIFWMVLIG
jgi:hypothetical protein